MLKLLCPTLLISSFLVLNAQAETKLNIVTDRADAVYATGETVTFQISLLQDGKPSGDESVDWTITKDGVPPIHNGTVKLKDGRATAIGTLNEPGFLQCKAVTQVDGKRLEATAGAAIDPEGIQPSMACPDDFDEFWNDQLARLDKVPLKVKLTPVPAPPDRPGIECFDIEIDCIGKPVRGYYSRPIGAKPGECPARLCVDGAGVRSTDLLASARWAQRGVISLAINAHGIPNGQPSSYYADLNGGELKNYRIDGRESRETYYFLNMFLRVQRALDFLCEQPEWDGDILMIEGGSQGGAQSMMGAAFDPRVSFYTAMVTAMCDHTGMVAGRVAGWPKVVPILNGQPDTQVLETSRYFDMVNFAPRIQAEGYFWVGFIDTTCPPTGVYAAYNQLTAPKTMVHATTSSHSLDGSKLWPAVAKAQQDHINQMQAKRALNK
ncbi:acetylxylan esterase [Cerasicoccus arenae]|uniref:Cephalosporin deacetylase n=1 Tax=Cerasicoccus arenae TaxID=424488 RepID=A0A8J3DIJ9_9BACT|nr:acetylxylan esterase [Cerasicoccus arenae]MBK1859608.1 acetylxylan esterase [Cerasicoccus arenae]GHC03614.1 cephalosporin deacetylase [Cerasicoccus arenae]